MTARVDLDGTEADFIEFEFPDEDTAKKAESCFPSDFVHTGGTTLQYRADPSRIENIRSRLEATGLSWVESESSLTEDDMWPEWPDDAPRGP